MSHDDLAGLMQRVQVLERAHRRYRIGGSILLSLGLVFFLCAARSLVSDGMMIRDGQGRDRAGMWVDEKNMGHAVMELIDEAGLVRYYSAIEPDGVVHSVYRDKQGVQRVDIGVDAQDRPFVFIKDAQGRVIRNL